MKTKIRNNGQFYDIDEVINYNEKNIEIEKETE